MNQQEQQLLKILSDYDENEYPKLISEAEDEFLLEHLSNIRGNIVRGFDAVCSLKDKRILEWDAGYGAVTGTLLEMECSVVSVVKSASEAQILKARMEADFKEFENRFQMLEESQIDCIQELFDYIVVTDLKVSSAVVLEKLLQDFKTRLVPNGKIIIACDNKYGLKYFAGCRDRFTKEYFSGIEGYVGHVGNRMFSKKEVKDVVDAVNLNITQVYYPYPDHRYAFEIYTDERLPKKGELNVNLRNFWEDRLLCFDETRVFDNLITDGVFPDFSNSYMFVLEKR